MQALNNALYPFIGPIGLNLSVNGGTVLINGNPVVFPNILIGLSANKTSFVFINIGTSTLQVNNTGFPANSYPIATAVTVNSGVSTLIDNRPDYVVTGSSTGIPGRFILAFGTPLISGNFSLSNWGTGASLSVTGKDSAHQITITAGTSPTQGAQVTLTFADGAWNTTPLIFPTQSGGTGMILPITSTSNTTSYTLTLNGLPISGKTYIVNVLVAGLS